MKKYRGTISADRYPMDFTVDASSWAVAAARLVRLWQKRFKRSRATELKIRIVRLDLPEVRDES